jgi:hypothetical protein
VAPATSAGREIAVARNSPARSAFGFSAGRFGRTANDPSLARITAMLLVVRSPGDHCARYRERNDDIHLIGRFHAKALNATTQKAKANMKRMSWLSSFSVI